MTCTCEWPSHCSGGGMVHCRNFGDCYCPCGCEDECYGCERCDRYDEDLADSDEEHVP